jgi:hypothetical protein
LRLPLGFGGRNHDRDELLDENRRTVANPCSGRVEVKEFFGLLLVPAVVFRERLDAFVAIVGNDVEVSAGALGQADNCAIECAAWLKEQDAAYFDCHFP